MYDLRLFISKRGRIKYVSHLDMFRIMQRTVRRACVPLWYTEGFNPHPYICFPLALPLGIESLGEPADIKIIGDTTPEQVKNALNAHLPAGLKIEKAALPYNKSAEITFAEYKILYDGSEITESELLYALSSGDLYCEKIGKSCGKKVVKNLDVSRCVKKFALSSEERNLRLDIVLCASGELNLNPFLLTCAIANKLDRELFFVSALRTALLCGDMTYFS